MRKLRERTVEQRVTRASFTRVIQQVEQTCPICEQKFWGARIRKYCGQPCRQKANYVRHAEGYRQARMERYWAEQKAAAGKK